MVFEKVCQLVAEQFTVDVEDITMETLFEEDLSADSLDIVELTMALEEEFDFGEIDDEELANIKSVGDVVRFVQRKIAE
ncbi:MAG: acyl carrier protein [Oscillospiraceae bacterium]|nr:acyl carrier protein [Oscillospiraceae bacterium]